MLKAHGEAGCGVTTNSQVHHPCGRIKYVHPKDEGTNPPSKGGPIKEEGTNPPCIKGERECVKAKLSNLQIPMYPVTNNRC